MVEEVEADLGVAKEGGSHEGRAVQRTHSVDVRPGLHESQHLGHVALPAGRD